MVTVGAGGEVETELTGATSIGRDFEPFWLAARPRIGRALALTLRDDELAADAVDEAMARAYQRWSTVSAMGNPEGWVYRVALNWALSALRRRRRLSAERPAERAAPEPAIAEPAVAAALSTLSPRLRAVVVCRLHLDWSVEETARALRIPTGTVKSRLNRALDALAVELEEP